MQLLADVKSEITALIVVLADTYTGQYWAPKCGFFISWFLIALSEKWEKLLFCGIRSVYEGSTIAVKCLILNCADMVFDMCIVSACVIL